MEKCEQVNIAWVLLLIGLLIWIFILCVEKKNLKKEIEQCDIKYFRLLGRVNELEIYNQPNNVRYYTPTQIQTCDD